MMTGNKWETFVLDLSFFGWNILSAITLGLGRIFYSEPYQMLTNSALYLTLKKTHPSLDMCSRMIITIFKNNT